MFWVITSNYYDAYAPVAVIEVPDDLDLAEARKEWEQEYRGPAPYPRSVIKAWCEEHKGCRWLEATELWMGTPGDARISTVGESESQWIGE